MPISAITSGVGAASGLLGGGSSGGSSSGQQQLFNTTAGNVPNPVSVRPMSNEPGQKAAFNSADLPIKNGPGVQARVTTANEVPAAHDSKSTVGSDYEQSWGNRLSRYIGYSSRQLG